MSIIGRIITHAMSAFFENPILNSPYKYPNRHWELDKDGLPTGNIIQMRRKAEFITPIPKARKKIKTQSSITFDEGHGLTDQKQAYDTNALINRIRGFVEIWRASSKDKWNVTPETARLLEHWRFHEFKGIRPFFCQLEAVETAIWLTEVASKSADGRKILEDISNANREANPELYRIALKLATGAGKTTVMAMIIAWQTINAVRYKTSNKFTRGFLIITPGLTIKDRLRVLFPNDPDSYFKRMELIPTDLMPEIYKARIVVTNYHAFKHRERIELSKGTRSLLEGNTGYEIKTLETDGQVMQRVAGELQGFKNIWVINDEAHHCYREKPDSDEDIASYDPDEREEVKKNKEAARLWISGIELVNRQVGVRQVIDLSATPFFLKGSGYAEGSLFHWTCCDFSLMDAIECGIVKLPRVPVADNIPSAEVPIFRNLWKNIRTKMPKKGRGSGGRLDPQALPPQLLTALDALYGHYSETHEAWKNAKIEVPPCFIIVCNNTATSKLVYDYISGYEIEQEDGSKKLELGKLELFRNYDQYGNALPKPNTLLIDSEQLESGEELSKEFKEAAEDELDRFKQEIIERTGDLSKGQNLSDADILREVMNTVGKKGRLGESIRCVVSVSMLTEGWDANTVTHILGVRAFGTQLLCEQVIGRALRRLSYDLNDEEKFNVEYADVLGIPFDFNAEAIKPKPNPPKQFRTVKAINPDREQLEMRFPNVVSYTYKKEQPNERFKVQWTENARYQLSPERVGATETTSAGIIGESVNLTLDNFEQLASARPSEILMRLASHVWARKFQFTEHGFATFGQVKQVCREWLDNYLECIGGSKQYQILYKVFADEAAERIFGAIVLGMSGERKILPVLDPFNPIGSTKHVQFNSSATRVWGTDPRKCHINYVICDSGWEAEFCRVLEKLPQVKAYVKNHNLGFEIPYLHEGERKHYRPDFIVHVERDGKPHFVIVEVKGMADEQDRAKRQQMETAWIPAVNNAQEYGTWSFVELRNPFAMEQQFIDSMEQEVTNQLLGSILAS